VTDEEQFFFDLQGFVVVDDVLTADEVAQLNAWVDAASAQQVTAGRAYLSDKAFRGLIDHPKVLPYLLTLVGPTVRLDRDAVVVTRPGDAATPVRGGAEPYDDAAMYLYQSGRMFNGLVTVSYALTDVAPGEGGFVAVPASHKSNYPFPDDWRDMEQAGPWLRPVPQQAGSALVFTEALAHGALPPTAGERRAVQMTYAPGAMSSARAYPSAAEAADGAWTDRQRSMLEPPYFQNRSFVSAD
jgi:hypothetical protein